MALIGFWLFAAGFSTAAAIHTGDARMAGCNRVFCGARMGRAARAITAREGEEGMMVKEKTTCNRENGSQSDLWGRNCWIADSVASLIQSRIEYLGTIHAGKFNAADPDHPLWDLLRDLDRYCEEIRVKNGLRESEVVTWNPLIQWPEEL